MDKNAIKKYAVWARRELIFRVSQRAALYGITEKNTGNPSDDSVGGKVLTPVEKKERQALIAQIHAKGYEEVMEEVAYTWFNRYSALRFMEVNGYLPSHVRVFTDDDNAFKPQILTEAINLEIDGIDMEKVYALKNANDDDELFKYLIIVQCNALSEILPGMFQHIADYTELLFPDNLLREGSVVEQMIALIPQEDWQDAVQILGWLYQYYNTEKKDDVFAALKKNVKITKENIPAATQLFTPDWIVRYMVENSLGRLWLEGHPNDELKSEWKYYLDETEQETQVQNQLAAIRRSYVSMAPDQIKCIDPCSGSGHICAYMFDVLMQIYEAYGYTSREAVASIVENNIYGIDIDERAAQLAYFAVMMKARQYDRRFFSRGIQPHVYAIQESNDLDSYVLDYFCDGKPELQNAIKILCDELHDAKEYGSILNVSQVNFAALYARIDEIREDISIYRETAIIQLVPFIQCAEAMAQKYDVTVTNPPYMGAGGMAPALTNYVKKNYPNSKTDLFAVFIEKCNHMLKPTGMQAMITQHAWMFLSSFEKLRIGLSSCDIINMAHLGARAFEEIGGEVVQTTTFVIRKKQVANYKGTYVRLVDFGSQDAKESAFLSGANRYTCSSKSYENIPNHVIAYWVSPALLHAFEEKQIKDFGSSCIGMRTGDNERFLRLWFEVSREKLGLGYESAEKAKNSGKKWFPYCKGGSFRKWYGNNDYVVNWENDGFEIKENTRRVYPYLGDNLGWKISNEQFYFTPGLTWSGVGASVFGIRSYPSGMIFDSGANSFFVNDPDTYYYFAGLLNTRLIDDVIKIINPTINTGCGVVATLPAIYSTEKSQEISDLVKRNIELSKQDWDAFETSWDFTRHPLLKGTRISDAYAEWENECDSRFAEMKRNEEVLNHLFNSIYSVENEIEETVSDSIVSVKKANLQREIKGLISYAVGCMFGRYSLDVPGVLNLSDNKNKSEFVIDPDNIIPICDDEYFEDDIVGRFVEFIRVAYGSENLEENLKYIAAAIGGKGQPRDVLRSYFMTDFYADHCNMYSVTGSGKRPIYWLFDSGKKGGFKALIYMHRYAPDTIARIRTDYVHEQQSRYRTAIADLQNRIANAGTSERVKLNKKLKVLQNQAEEIRVYEEKIHHLADQMINIDLDDGIKVNYAKFQDVLAKIK